MNVTAEFLRRIAAAAAAETLPRFRAQGAVANKEAAGFDPVTEADREAERAIKALILKEFPDHGILGEEHGIENADSSHVWVIDPIDGTRAFISGLPVWGTLVGLTIDGDAVAGLMSQPFTGELFYATDSASHYEGPGGPRILKTRATTTACRRDAVHDDAGAVQGRQARALRQARELGAARPLRHRLLCLRHGRGRPCRHRRRSGPEALRHRRR